VEKRRQKYLAAISFVMMTASLPIVGSHVSAEHNYYISLLVAAIVFLPIFLIMLRLCDLCGKCGGIFKYFAMKSETFARILSLIFSIYAVFSAFTNLRIMGDEIKNIALFNTPMLYVFAFAFIVYVYVVPKGFRVIGHFSALYIPVIVLGIFAYVLLSIGRFEWGNLEPLFISDINDISQSALCSITGLFGDCILLLFISGQRDEKEEWAPLRKRYFLLSYAATVFVLLGTVITSILVLGGDIMSKLYFPHYISASLLSIGSVSRLEVLLNVLLFIAINIKVIFSLYCADYGLRYFLCGDREVGPLTKRVILFSVCAGICLCAAFAFSSTAEFFHYMRYYRYFGVFVFVIPVTLWIFVEIIERRYSISKTSTGRLKL